jgi:hypothetical protein
MNADSQWLTANQVFQNRIKRTAESRGQWCVVTEPGAVQLVMVGMDEKVAQGSENQDPELNIY